MGAFVIRELIGWIKFDARDMVLVDNRDSREHAPHAMAGTMYYSSGKVLKLLVPVASFQLFVLAVGSILCRQGAAGGPWVLGAGVLTLSRARFSDQTFRRSGSP